MRRSASIIAAVIVLSAAAAGYGAWRYMTGPAVGLADAASRSTSPVQAKRVSAGKHHFEV